MKPVKSQHGMNRRFASAANELAIATLTGCGSELSLSQASALLRADYKSVINAEIDPRVYSRDQACKFRDDYLAVELMSKYPNWELGIDRKQVAFTKFRESEEVCAETNFRLSQRIVNGALSPYTPESMIFMAREKILRLLGPFNWDHAERHMKHGPGATSKLRAIYGDAYYKYGAKPHSTRQNALLAYTAIRRVPTWYFHVAALADETPDSLSLLPMEEQIRKCIDIVEGNRVVTVPKNAKTDRIIAIEPQMNVFVQAGIGGLIRSRLKRTGVDLNDQTRNQVLAHLGSIDGSVSTIDLAAASDTVSMRLVEELLPPDWLEAIKLSRSPVGILPDGTRVEYQKVSSMGNGYTFELESLIFWALSSAVCSLFRIDQRQLSIYGDDIIIPTAAAHSLIWLLKHCGFSTNTKKSFVDGCFRESCGKHYFNGLDVTPLYVREDIQSPERAIWFANQIRRYSRLSWGLDGRFFSTYEKCIGLLPTSLRKPTIPDGYGDAALIGDFDEVLPSKLNRGNDGWFGTVHVRVSKTRQFCDLPFLIRSLEKIGRPRPSLAEVLMSRVINPVHKAKELVLSCDNGVPMPSKFERWLSVKIPVVQWVSFGPWWV